MSLFCQALGCLKEVVPRQRQCGAQWCRYWFHVFSSQQFLATFEGICLRYDWLIDIYTWNLAVLIVYLESYFWAFIWRMLFFQIPCTVSRIWCPQLTLYALWKRIEFELVLLHFKDGHFDRGNFNCGPSMPSSPGETLCAAVSASAWVEPHGKCTVAFALAWSSPKIKFLKGSSYHRYIYDYPFPFSCSLLLPMFLICIAWKSTKILYPCVQCFYGSLIFFLGDWYLLFEILNSTLYFLWLKS